MDIKALEEKYKAAKSASDIAYRKMWAAPKCVAAAADFKAAAGIAYAAKKALKAATGNDVIDHPSAFAMAKAVAYSENPPVGY